jgi:2-deoxy-D-gluconate 3-dehydrogenase
MNQIKNSAHFDLTGKAAMVTGGNGGIGKALAEGLLNSNAGVVIVGRNKSKLEQAEADLTESTGGRVLGVQADLIEEEEVKRAIARGCEHFGKLDILVNNAGVNLRKKPQDYDMAEWDQIIAINLRTPFMCAKHIYPVMKKAGGGKIINIGSMNTLFGGARLAPYGASKAAVVQMTKSLSASWAAENIQVNAILPGWINTEMGAQARRDMPGLNESVLNRTPAKRWGETGDLIGAMVFLASNASDFVTGAALPVDGGFSIFLI